MTADDHHRTDLQAHVFEGPLWDDPEEVEPERTTSAEGEQDDNEDDVEAHASGFG